LGKVFLIRFYISTKPLADWNGHSERDWPIEADDNAGNSLGFVSGYGFSRIAQAAS